MFDFDGIGSLVLVGGKKEKRTDPLSFLEISNSFFASLSKPPLYEISVINLKSYKNHALCLARER